MIEPPEASPRQFLVQHHGDSRRVGYYSTWTEASSALDEVADGFWQGIRDVRIGERWWRQGGDWIVGPPLT